MKIVFLIQDFSRGHGSERGTALIASYLAEQGNCIQIVSICGNNTSFYPLNKDIKLVTLINRPEVDNKKAYFRVLKKYNAYLSEFQPDVVVDVFAAMSIYTLALRKKYGYKNITWEHYNYFNNMGFYKYWRKAAVRYSDRIVVLTQTDMDTYIQNNPTIENRIEYIYNPTPFNSITTGQSEKRKIVLAVGRLVKLKGYDHLIDIWKIVEPKCEEWSLIVVGEGEEREALEKKIAQYGLNRIRLVGETTDIAKYYRMSSILVSTSDVEGLPMNMIEAQSFGIPIVSYDYYTGPKEIITNGIDGYVIRKGSQEGKDQEMSDVILQIIQDAELRETMSKNAKENSKRFSMDTIGGKWTDLLAKLNKV